MINDIAALQSRLEYMICGDNPTIERCIVCGADQDPDATGHCSACEPTGDPGLNGTQEPGMTQGGECPSWERLPLDGVICECPFVEIRKKGDYAEVRYDVDRYGYKQTEDAFDRIGDLIQAYSKENKTFGRRARAEHGLVGGDIAVLREHAREFAVRLLVFIADPKNVTGSRPYLGVWGDPRPEELKQVEEAEAERGRIWAGLKARFPECAVDPLSQVPGVPAADHETKEVACA